MNIQTLQKKALEATNVGHYDDALKILKKILKKYPMNFEALANSGLIEFQKKNFINAKKYFLNALVVKQDIKIIDHLSESYRSCSEWDEIIKLRNDHMNCKSIILEMNYAQALRFKNEKLKCIESYKNLLKKHQHINIYIAYGFSLNYFELYDDAIEVYKEGLNIDPGNYYLNYNMGVAYANNEDPESSMTYLKKNIEQNANNFDAWITLAAQQIKLRLYDDAIKSIKKCNEISPNHPYVLFQTAIMNIKNADIENGKKLLRKFLNLDPENPDGNFYYGIILLYEKNFKDAIKYYRYRRKIKKPYGRFDDFEFPDIHKDSKVIIGWEQGIGDQLLYLRLLNSFIIKYPNVTLITTDKLFDLIAPNFPDISVINTTECEKVIENSSDSIKINQASLLYYEENVEDSLKKAKKMEILDIYKFPANFEHKKKKIGISWSSQNKNIGKEKSISLEEYHPIFQIEDTNFINLQSGDVLEEINLVQEKLKTQIYHDKELDYFNDIKKLAALANQCDYIVTTSNVTAHIAGSIGIKTYVLIPHGHGKLWYWFSNDENCIWYPSITLINQKKDKSWKDEIIKIKEIIEKEN